jgi:hypothetical protein
MLFRTAYSEAGIPERSACFFQKTGERGYSDDPNLANARDLVYREHRHADPRLWRGPQVGRSLIEP